MVSVLEMLAAGNAREVAQPSQGASYARKIQDDEAVIDWSRPAAQIERAVRARVLRASGLSAGFDES